MSCVHPDQLDPGLWQSGWDQDLKSSSGEFNVQWVGSRWLSVLVRTVQSVGHRNHITWGHGLKMQSPGPHTLL